MYDNPIWAEYNCGGLMPPAAASLAPQEQA
jgi:hypothetical protein